MMELNKRDTETTKLHEEFQGQQQEMEKANKVELQQMEKKLKQISSELI